MPSHSPSPVTGPQEGAKIDKLDFDASRLRVSRTQGEPRDSSSTEGGRLLRDDASFFSDVVDGVIQQDRRKMRQKMIKYVSFASAILSCLCAGSITAYSLYGPLFLRHLKYSQYQVNAVSTTAEIALYLPVPLVGWFCDRYNPRPVSAFSGFAMGIGYFLAAGVYRAGPERITYRSVHGEVGGEARKEGWPFGVMLFAFVCIGVGTVCMYFAAITTCAKNFGRGKHKGIALAIPIAAFGLSGMWQSQVGSHFFADPNADGNVNVFHYFCFLGGLLFAVGLIGSVGLWVVGEEELIEEGVGELERSGHYEETRSLIRQEPRQDGDDHRPNYGTVDPQHENRDPDSTTEQRKAHHDKAVNKKNRLLNAETLLFLSDSSAYFLAGGFFLTSGPGEAYLNNLGTLVHTLYPPGVDPPSSNSPATHVSVVAVTSTLARLATGTLADLLAPPGPVDEPGTGRRRSSGRDSEGEGMERYKRRICTLPRPALLLAATLLFSIGQLLLATPLIQQHPLVLLLNTSLVGLGYGAIFSLTPIIISVVWGVQNFGTNWGIVAIVPAAGAAVWGAIYSAVYSAGDGLTAGHNDQGDGGRKHDTLGGGEECYGSGCYQITFGAMAVSSWLAIVLWSFAWKRWRAKGVVV